MQNSSNHKEMFDSLLRRILHLIVEEDLGENEADINIEGSNSKEEILAAGEACRLYSDLLKAFKRESSTDGLGESALQYSRRACSVRSKHVKGSEERYLL